MIVKSKNIIIYARHVVGILALKMEQLELAVINTGKSAVYLPLIQQTSVCRDTSWHLYDPFIVEK